MRTHITFQTEMFETPPASGFCTDNGLSLGGDCVRWLASHLTKNDSISVDETVIEEDYGCIFFAKINSFDFEIAVALQGPNPATWFLAVFSTGARRTTPTFLRWQGHSDDAEKLRLCIAVDAVLKSEPEIHSVRWYSDEPGVFTSIEIGQIHQQHSNQVLHRTLLRYGRASLRYGRASLRSVAPVSLALYCCARRFGNSQKFLRKQ